VNAAGKESAAREMMIEHQKDEEENGDNGCIGGERRASPLLFL
jgi:hypothetical protein